jgi:hypothetical protein
MRLRFGILKHRQSVCFDTSVTLHEHIRHDVLQDQACVGIRVVNDAHFLIPPDSEVAPFHAASQKQDPDRQETLHFIPYFARANRGGKGQMRVGLRVKTMRCASIAD